MEIETEIKSVKEVIFSSKVFFKESNQTFVE